MRLKHSDVHPPAQASLHALALRSTRRLRLTPPAAPGPVHRARHTSRHSLPATRPRVAWRAEIAHPVMQHYQTCPSSALARAFTPARPPIGLYIIGDYVNLVGLKSPRLNRDCHAPPRSGGRLLRARRRRRHERGPQCPPRTRCAFNKPRLPRPCCPPLRASTTASRDRRMNATA